MPRAGVFSLLLGLTVLSVHAQDAPPGIRICNESGCSEQARDTVTFNPQAAVDPALARQQAELVALADKDPRAAYDLGLRHFRGDGVPQDSHRALLWMRNAASRGYLPAQTALGRLYLGGLEEMGADPAEAEKWLQAAAGRGDKEAAKLLIDAQQAKRSEAAYQRWKESQREQSRNFWLGMYEYQWQWRDDDRWHERHVPRSRRY